MRRFSDETDAVRPRALVDVSRRDVLDSLLAANPDALVGAVTPSGAPAAIPAGIPLGPDHQTYERSLLELVVPEDTTAVADAFFAALSKGVAVASIRLASEPDRALLLQYIDLREDYGVLMRLVVPKDGADGAAGEAIRASSLAPSRPRLGMMTKDEVARILSVDTAISLMLGWTDAEMVGRRNLEFIHPDDHVRAIDNWMSRVLADRMSMHQTVRLRYLCKDGSWLWLETSNESQLQPDGTTVIVARLFDVSEEMAAVEALRHSEQFLRRLTDTVPVGLFHISADGDVAFVNPVLQALIGEEAVHSRSELAASLLSGQSSLLDQAIREVMTDGADADLDISLGERGERTRSSCRINLRAITDEQRVLGVLGCVVDVTELRSMADTDALTGLQNRRSIMETLSSNLATHGGRVAVIYLDLDGFKPINDLMGHHVGDELLKGVADRLRDVVRTTDQVGRHGGDEFLIVCPGIGSRKVAMALARRVQGTIQRGFPLADASVSVTASIGVACGRPGMTADELVSSADGAMYDAKKVRGGPPRHAVAGNRHSVPAPTSNPGRPRRQPIS